MTQSLQTRKVGTLKLRWEDDVLQDIRINKIINWRNIAENS